ncbi:hypothetical protein PHET_04846 [Paragonimus heterotremus]|uniref:Mitochondrial protein M19 n=1 Tax=Paragonimus heterotremus TaxID=100268 RepID=A0A8J4TLY0_9TREM|nr:hypothetical protein PHET_04846 [Paragonimus heterotremus]
MLPSLIRSNVVSAVLPPSMSRFYSSPGTHRLREFQALADQWPADTCNRKHTLRDLIQTRVQHARANPQSDCCSDLEYQSFLRILNNYHRDRYKLPSGLGQNPLNTKAPRVGATGADLTECRRILMNQDEYLERQIPLWQRAVSQLKAWFPYFSKTGE